MMFIIIIMQLLLLNTSHVSLFVRFGNLFVVHVGTLFIHLFSEFTGVEIGIANYGKVAIRCDDKSLQRIHIRLHAIANAQKIFVEVNETVELTVDKTIWLNNNSENSTCKNKLKN